MVSHAIPEKVLRYEKFVNETLKEDLRKVLDERDEVYADLSEHLQLKTVIERLQTSECGMTCESPEKKNLKTKVDLGCNFYVQAKIDDATMIYVSVGFGFFVEFTHDEALRFIEKKTEHLTLISDSLTRDASRIKAHIKLVLEGLREIQLIDDRPGEKQHRNTLFQ